MPRRAVNPSYEIAKALAKLEKASFGEILKEANISRQALDNHLKRLLDKKLILAEEHPKDKRKWLYSLNPNELCIITTDEVIELIRNELKAVNEELTAEEEQELREWLIKHFRTILIEEIKSKLHLDRYPIEQHIKDWLNWMAVLHQIIIKPAVSKKEKGDGTFSKIAEKGMKALFVAQLIGESRKRGLSPIVEYAFSALAEFPDSIADKWMKTKAFVNNPIIASLRFLKFDLAYF